MIFSTNGARRACRALFQTGAYVPAKLLESQAAFFKALGHPSRLLMVKALAGGELCVCELQKLVGADMSTVSKHLAVLKHAGVLEADRRGNNIYYRLAFTCLSAVLACLDKDCRLPRARNNEQCACSDVRLPTS